MLIRSRMSAILQWPASERPRERLLAGGAAGLSDAELLALVVGATTRASGGVVETCRELLGRLGGIEALERCRVGELIQVRGIGQARACAPAGGGRAEPAPAGSWTRRGEPLTRSEAVYRCVGGRLLGLRHEVFVVLALDAKNRLLSLTQVAQGSVTGVEVHPREVFAPLLREQAAAGIVAHNHPSGDPEPSEADRQLTDRLAHGGRLLGIPLLDHLVVGDGSFVSFADRGWV
ncbi:MAG: DNA repair protein RadC [Proteobacteria bacterium]|nr:DNA repair protein RadC [Pseudomonadota bacterium]